MGQPKTAVDLTEKGLRMHTDLGMPFWRSTCHFLCSYAHFELDDCEKARNTCRTGSSAFWKTMKGNFGDFNKLAWEGSCQNERNASRGGGTGDSQGIILLKLGLAFEVCLGHLWLGEVYAESGRREEALGNLKKAETMFREMGMDYWLGKGSTSVGGM